MSASDSVTVQAGSDCAKCVLLLCRILIQLFTLHNCLDLSLYADHSAATPLQEQRYNHGIHCTSAAAQGRHPTCSQYVTLVIWVCLLGKLLILTEIPMLTGKPRTVRMRLKARPVEADQAAHLQTPAQLAGQYCLPSIPRPVLAVYSQDALMLLLLVESQAADAKRILDRERNALRQAQQEQSRSSSTGGGQGGSNQVQ